MKSGLLKLSRILIFAAFAVGQVAMACSCYREPLDELFARARIVAEATVVNVQLITATPAHGKEAEWEATLEPTRIYKGEAPRLLNVKFSRIYVEEGNTGPIPGSGCEVEMTVGDEYLLSIAETSNLRYTGWCDNRFLHTSVFDETYRTILGQLRDGSYAAIKKREAIMSSMSILELSARGFALVGQATLLWLLLRASRRFKHSSFTLLALGNVIGIALSAVGVLRLLNPYADPLPNGAIIAILVTGICQVPVVVWGMTWLLRRYEQLHQSNSS